MLLELRFGSWFYFRLRVKEQKPPGGASLKPGPRFETSSTTGVPYHEGKDPCLLNRDIQLRCIQLQDPAALPRIKYPWYPQDKRMGGPQSTSGRGVEQKNPCPCQESNPGRLVRSNFTDWTVLNQSSFTINLQFFKQLS
jgi:hypothetical protein